MGGEPVSSQHEDQRTVDVHYNLTSYTKSDVDDDNKLLSRHLDVLQRENLSELEILEAFGINEKELREVLTPISRNLLEIFYYFKHGQTLSKNDDFSLLDSMLNTENIKKLWTGDQLSLEALLRMLLLITDYFQNRKIFFDKNVIRIPYLFNDKECFDINFNNSENTFEVINKFHIHIDGFSSVKYDFHFNFIVEQLVNF